jgi:hypothetical protein
VRPIDRFRWTDHALLRLDQRHLATFEVEQAIREQHEARRPNDGRANWLIAAKTPDGRAFEAIYDHPIAGDESVALIVSVWRID